MDSHSNLNLENNQMNAEIQQKEISLEDLFTLLKVSFTETDNSKRKQAEDKLNSLQVLIASNYIPSIINIILDNNNQYDMKSNTNLRLSLILYIKNILKNIFITKEFNIDNIKLILNSLFPLMIASIEFPENIKSNVSLLFIELLNLPQLRIDTSPFTGLLNELNNINTQDLGQVSAALFIFTSMSNSSILMKDSDNFIQYVGTILTVIDAILISTDNIINQITSLSNENEINNYIAILKIKRQCFDLIFMKVTRMKRFNKYNDTIAASIIEKFLFKVSSSILHKHSELFNSSLLETSNLICMTTLPEFDKACNNMKVKAIQIISLFLQFESIEIKNKTLYEQSNFIFNGIFSSLIEIITKRIDYFRKLNINNEYPDNGYEAMIFQFGLLISRFIIREPAISSFKHDIERFVTSIIFPILISTDTDFMDLMSNGENHYFATIDILNDFKHKTYKTSFAFLLTKIVEKYDGLITFIINSVVQILEFVEIKSKDHPIDYNINLPREIFSSFSVENIIEMCFTVLNITYKAILKHPKFPIVKKHILEKLNEIAFIPGKSPESNFSKVFSNEMVIDKFILFIGTYSDGLFYDIRIDENGVVIEFITDENSKKLCHALEYLFNCLNYFEKAPGIAYQASNTIKSLFENPKGKNLIKEFLNSKISQMILLIEEIQIVLFFDILESVEASIVDVTHVYSMVKALVKRILKEIKSNKHDDQKINIYISKCFNILESIIKRHVGNDNSAKIPVIKMEEEIKEIILYIKNPNRIDFEDDILRLTYRLLEKSQDITDSSKLVFDCLNRVICNHGCIKRETFDFLYQIISKKNKEFLESPNIQKDLRDIVLFKEDEDDYTSVYTSMLMQIWVLKSNSIIPEILLEILEVKEKELQEIIEFNDDHAEDICDAADAYKIMCLVGVIYGSCINFKEHVLDYFVRVNKINSLPMWLEFVSEIISYSLIPQIKMILIGLSSILGFTNFIEKCPEIYPKFLNCALKLLNKQKSDESTKLKENIQTQLDCGFIDNENDDEINDFGMLNHFNNLHGDNEEAFCADINDIFVFAFSEYKNEDEFVTIRNIMHGISNNPIVNSWFNALSSDDKEAWKNLMQIRRYNVDGFNLIRKKVTIKRNKE